MEPDGAAGYAKIFQCAWNMCSSLSRIGTYLVLKHTTAQMLINHCCALFCSQTQQNTLFQRKCRKLCAPVENAASQLPAALQLGMSRNLTERKKRTRSAPRKHWLRGAPRISPRIWPQLKVLRWHTKHEVSSCFRGGESGEGSFLRNPVRIP